MSSMNLADFAVLITDMAPMSKHTPQGVTDPLLREGERFNLQLIAMHEWSPTSPARG